MPTLLQQPLEAVRAAFRYCLEGEIAEFSDTASRRAALDSTCERLLSFLEGAPLQGGAVDRTLDGRLAIASQLRVVHRDLRLTLHDA